MRSSKSRSRSKSNRNRSMGNIVNRVFDSSGPEGKVRGTPQQIIDKYNQLARDAQLANDRVAFENFQQHAEHYTRMLGEALREQEAFRAQQQDQRQQGGGDRQDDRRDDRDRGGDQPRQHSHRDDDARFSQPSYEQPTPEQRREPESRRDDVIEVPEEADSGLVETPESSPSKPRKPRRPKKSPDDAQGGEPASGTPEAAE